MMLQLYEILNYEKTIPKQLLEIHQKGQGLKTMFNISPLLVELLCISSSLPQVSYGTSAPFC